MDVSTETTRPRMDAKRTGEVRPIRSRFEREEFIRLPWRIYRDDPHWVPPLLMERREFINPAKQPFYRHGAAQAFVAWRGETPIGRILVSDDPLFNEQHGANAGCFGLF